MLILAEQLDDGVVLSGLRHVVLLDLRTMTLVEQELHSLPEHLSSPPVFSSVRVTRSLVFCICFADRCLSFFTFLWPLCCLFIDSDFPFGVFKLFFLQMPCCEPYSYNLAVQDSNVELLSTSCSWHV